MLCKKRRTAISRGSLPAWYKSAKLFLLRKLSTCGPLPSAPEMQACHSGYHVIKPSSGGKKRGREAKSRGACGAVPGPGKVGCYLYVSPISPPACLATGLAGCNLLPSCNSTVLTPDSGCHVKPIPVVFLPHRFSLCVPYSSLSWKTTPTLSTLSRLEALRPPLRK